MTLFYLGEMNLDTFIKISDSVLGWLGKAAEAKKREKREKSAREATSNERIEISEKEPVARRSPLESAHVRMKVKRRAVKFFTYEEGLRGLV